jgi:hypothetical protein
MEMGAFWSGCPEEFVNVAVMVPKLWPSAVIVAGEIFKEEVCCVVTAADAAELGPLPTAFVATTAKV